MSATGRGAKRNEADFYPTPAACTLAILRALPLPGGRWLEPSAGEGSIIRAVNSTRSDVEWTACELRDACSPMLRSLGVDPVVGDFLNPPPCLDPLRFDVAILNPPFVAALPFIQRCLAMADWVVCLQRLNYIGPAGRKWFWRAHMPDLYVLANRPSFTDGGTDMTEYAWFVWPPREHNRTKGRVEVLEANPGQMLIKGAISQSTLEA